MLLYSLAPGNFTVEWNQKAYLVSNIQVLSIKLTKLGQTLILIFMLKAKKIMARSVAPILTFGMRGIVSDAFFFYKEKVSSSRGYF